jgi:hypothetical protein
VRQVFSENQIAIIAAHLREMGGLHIQVLGQSGKCLNIFSIGQFADLLRDITTDDAPVEREVVNRLTPWASETGGTT